MSSPAVPVTIRSTIPARIDRLPWTPFHTRLVLGLGTAWILDGLQITIASSVAGVLTQPDTLDLTSVQVGLIATVYLLGQVTGALIFGKLSDRLGRRRLFTWTLGLYLIGGGMTAFTMGDSPAWLAYFYLTRFIAGMGIGGEYSAINSAIDELMPAKYRGRVDVWINGSYWAGAILGSFVTLFFLDVLPVDLGWKVSFLAGPVLALVIIYVRKTLPESPRWLLYHGRADEADDIMNQIEHEAVASGHLLTDVPEDKAVTLSPGRTYGYLAILRLTFGRYTKRAILGATLMITQSFLYNAIFFTYAIVLTQFYGVAPAAVPLYGLAFSVGNLAGPLILAPLFDILGRKRMIAGTYLISAVTLALSGFLFEAGVLSAVSQTVIWVVVFFFASAGASAAYLTVSETWPIEIRAQAIAVFFAIAQIVGSMGPLLFGWLIGNGEDPTRLLVGYLVGAGVMAIGGIVELLIGINAEGKSLEDVTDPLSAVSDDSRP